MKVRLERKKESHGNDINTAKPRHGLNLKCASVWWWLCVISNTWSWIHEKVKQHWGWVDKSVNIICMEHDKL